MLTLHLGALADGHTILVQEEPDLELAMPQVFDQPPLPTLHRGRIPNVEALVAKLFRRHQADPLAGLGPDYQTLVTEYQPLFQWAIACWDFLLSTEGCRFVLRNGEHKAGARGDYRAITDSDYSRLVHGIFRTCVLDFARTPHAPSLSLWLRERFWPMTLEAYRRFDQPPDPRQRSLTAYSYLRCVPYQFLNDVHQELVDAVVARLPEREGHALNAYFFHFFTEPATAQALGCSLEDSTALLRQGLIRLLVDERLVYCLLRQIERY